MDRQRNIDFFDNILNSVTHGRQGQFDGIEIVGKREILDNLLGVVPLKLYSTPPKNTYKDWVVICSSPFQVWVPKNYCKEVMNEMGKMNNVVAIESKNETTTNKSSSTFSSYDFTDMLLKLNITNVCVKSYGEKSQIVWGVAIMRKCREADPECAITFDIAANIRPEQVHWKRQTNMVPELREGDGGFITLARWDGTPESERELGKGARIYHNPLLVHSQMWWFNGVHNNLPLYGGVEVEKIKGSVQGSEHHHQYLRKLNVYNTLFHQWHQTSKTGMESWQFNSVGCAKPRLANLEEFHRDGLSMMQPQLRIEVRMELPNNSIIRPSDLLGNKWINNLSFVWEELLFAWENLSVIHIPTSFIIKSAEIATAYARNMTAVPRFAWAFCGRASIKLDATRSYFAMLIFNCYGLSSQCLGSFSLMTFKMQPTIGIAPYDGWLGRFSITTPQVQGISSSNFFEPPPSSPCSGIHLLPSRGTTAYLSCRMLDIHSNPSKPM